MKAVAWEPPAAQELADAVAASPDPAALQQAVEAALNDIASGLVTHARAGRGPVRRCILPGLPYSIIYLETDAEVRVFVFPHHKRRPGSWKSRLPRP